MKILLLSLCVLFSAAVFAQAPAIQWNKSFGGTQADQGNAIAATPDGGFIVAGLSNSSNGDVTANHPPTEAWVIKLSNSGAIQWQKTYGGNYSDVFYSIATTTDSGYIATGYTASTDGDVTGVRGYTDWWVVKLSSTGELQWQKTLGGKGNDLATSIMQTPDGGYVVGGSGASTDGDFAGGIGNVNALVVKLKSDGTTEWKRVISSGYSDVINDIKPAPGGGYICTGYSSKNFSDEGRNGLIVRLGPAGDVKWQKKYDNGNEDVFKSIDIDSDGNYIAAGYAYHDAWIVKTDTTGNILMQKKFGGENNKSNLVTKIISLAQGNYIATGYKYMILPTEGDIENLGSWVLKINKSGNTIWQTDFSGNNFSSGLAVTADNGYGLSGTINNVNADYDQNYFDAWVVKSVADTFHIGITASPSSSICTGTSVTFTAISSGGIYQWQKNHINVGANSNTYKDSALQNGDTVLCILTTDDSAFISNAIGITVATPTTSIVGPGLLCAGDTATYKATASLAGHPIRYQWKKNNINVGTNSNLYTDSHINNWDSIWCTIVSDAGCTAGAGLTSNKIVVKTLAYGTVTATVTYNPHNYKLCAPSDTTSVTFHAVGQFGGANPSFQWVLNNNIAGTDSSFYTANGLKAGDKVYCRYTSSQKCVTGDVHTVITNTVTLTTKATLTPSITIIQTPDTAVCSGTKVRFKVSSLTGGGENPIYQWMKNNVPVGTNNDIYYDSTLANNDSVWCKMTSHHPCLAGPSTVTSNKKKVTVDNALPPKPSAISGPSSVTANQANISYSVSSINNVTYLWSIPTDASFVTDKHNNSVTVNWGSSTGNVIAQTRNGCGYSAKRVLAVSVSPSLVNAGESSQAIIAAGKASLYPNPAKNFAMVSFTAAAAGKYIVQVADASGRILQVKETNAVKGRNTININVNGYAKGSYFVRLTNKDGKQQATFTLVVAK